MNKFLHRLPAVIAMIFLALPGYPAVAEEVVKIGVILPLTGPFADYGEEISNGLKLYMKQNGDTVAGKKISLIIRDDTGIAPEMSKRLAQDMLVQDKVDILAGFGLTPAALAVAPLATQAKKVMVIMNAATSVITTKSPYIVRLSHTLPQISTPMATYAVKHGIKKVYTLVADYGPGIDAETAFKKAFEAAGNKLVGEVRVPVNNVDFSSYIQRIKDAAPEAIFLFLPPGSATIAFLKAYKERGLDKAGITLLATVDFADDNMMDALGPSVLGVISSGHYSAAHDSPLNKAYVKAYAEAYGTKMRPNFMSVAGYDGMAAIYAALRKTNGDADGDKLIAAMKGLQFESPRGPVMIDPETRDIIQTVYYRRAEERNGKLYNIEFDQIKNVKDPGK
jgi:branched-chain amino acid transport system substrate-binding protein